MLHILLSSQMLFQLLNEYLICPFNLINSILLPYLVIWEISSTITTTTIWSHSGIILAVTSDLSTYWLTKSWNVTGSTPLCPVEYYGSLVKKKECNSIVKKWQMYFQASNFKGKHFLNSNNNDNQHIHFIYSKDSTWLKYFGLSNLLCA